MERKKNIIYFESDDEFLDYCIIKMPVVRENKHCKYIDFDFSKEYLKELEKGTRFCIKDENSLITKREAVTFRTESKRIENLEPWFGVEL